jgi:CheY-like chemotaxis protein
MARILVIEDEPAIRQTLTSFLRMEGHEVLAAADGAAGIAAARRDLPDLVLCDLLMPELHGYQVLSLLRSESCTASIPFILITASAAREEHQAGLARGAAAFLTKPFHLEDVRAAIARYLPDDKRTHA